MNLHIDSSRLLDDLNKLLLAHAPSGSEEEVDHLVMELARSASDAIWQDAADSIIIHISGHSSSAPIAVAAHKDEIAMIVKRVEDDGRLRVRPIGGLWPWAIGEGPVEILGREGLIPGVLSVGSKHVAESPVTQLKDAKALTWDMVWVETKLDEEALKKQGVRVGSKVVIARSRKSPWSVGEYICGYNLDCRGGVAALIETARHLKAERPAQDVYLIASSEEEVGGHGVTYSVGQLPAETIIALDIVPVASEYQTRNCGDPVLVCQDGHGVYHQRTIQHLENLAADLDFGVQTAVLASYGSDASIAKATGAAARSALIGYPGDNTHGYEICAIDGIVNTARLLLAYLYQPLT